MDATPIDPSAATTLACDVCGYPRQGLPAEARCPECGQPPPQLIAVPRVVLEPHSAQEMRWLRCIAFGAMLLLLTSCLTVTVTLVTPLESYSLIALNVPAPKCSTVVLLQRALGSEPGPWGVTGSVAFLFSVIGLWFLTEPPTLRHSIAADIPGRALTRWFGTLGGGGAFGAMLAFSWHRWSSNPQLPVLMTLLLVIDLPCAALLYRYLWHLSRRFDNARAGEALQIARFGIPLLIAAGIAAALIRMNFGATQQTEVILAALYGGAATVMAMIALAGYLRLSATLASRAFATLFYSLATMPTHRAVQRLLQASRHAANALLTARSRWPLVVGLFGFVLLLYPNAGASLGMVHRFGVGGDAPAVNWIGPKLSLIPAVAESGFYDDRIDFSAAVSVLLVLYLLTSWREDERGELTRNTTRWVPVALLGFAFATQVHGRDQKLSAAEIVITCVGLFDVPATALLYLYFSRLSHGLGLSKLARRFAAVGVGGTLLQLLPLVCYPLGRSMPRWRMFRADWIFVFAYGAISMCLTMFALDAVLRLASFLGHTHEQPRIHPGHQ